MIKCVSWIKETAENELAFSYWNNVELEKNKPYYVVDSDVQNALNYVQSLGVDSQVEVLVKEALDGKADNLSLVSLGSGIAWEAFVYRKIDKIAKIYFVDFSKHRIHNIAPKVLDASGCGDDKEIELVHGSFYELALEDEKADLVTACEALMMAENPEEFLKEANRVLKRGGTLVICGEPRVKSLTENVSIALHLWNGKRRPDISGAHHYLLFEYRRMFKKSGFQLHRVLKSNENFWAFSLIKL